MAITISNPEGLLVLITAEDTCTDEDCITVPQDPSLIHSNITGYDTTLSLTSNTTTADTISTQVHFSVEKIGHIISFTLPNPLNANPSGGASVYQQCHTYGSHFSPYAKLRKVENYIANESFHAEREETLKAAEMVLHVQEVWLDPPFRRRELGRRALRQLIDETFRCERAGHKGGVRCGVVLLEPGPVGGVWLDGVETEGGMEAVEKIERCWRKMGFAAWSESDSGWLCLGVEY